MNRADAMRNNRRDHLTHGHNRRGHRSPEYEAWAGMLRRCRDKSDPLYGARLPNPVTVCDEWQNSFEAFYAHVGDRPSPSHSIDRYPDNHGNYEPGNVRWATASEQNYNRRDYEYARCARINSDAIRRLSEQRMFSQRDLAKIFSVSKGLIFNLLHTPGWVNSVQEVMAA